MALFEKLKNVFKGNEKKDIKRVQNIVENSKTLNIVYKNEHVIIQGYNAVFLDEYVSDVINLYNLDVQGNDIIINYDNLYEFYYSDENERIYIYKILNLPELFDGYVRIENSNFFGGNDLYYNFKFESKYGNFNILKNNILKNNINDKHMLIPKELYNLVKILINYNSDKEKINDTAYQFEILKYIKDYAKQENIILSTRIKEEPSPIIIDKIKVDFTDNGNKLELYPKLSDDIEENKKFIQRINQFKDIKGTYSIGPNENKKRIVVKNKLSLKKIMDNNIYTGEDRLNILKGCNDMFEDENIDISEFGPRVVGIGYLTYKQNSPSIQTNDLDWLDKNIDLPYIEATNIFGDFEQITLKPEDKLNFQKKLVELEETGASSIEVEFNTEDNKPLKIIMNEDDIKQEIRNISLRVKNIDDIDTISDLQNILDISDEFEGEEYIPYKGIYIEKGVIDVKDQINTQMENIRKRLKDKTKDSQKKSLLIAENFDGEEYKEIEYIHNIEHNLEIPEALNKNIELFEYQKDSLYKLQKLYLDSEINGFLMCDDMGLGKTLQLLSFVAWLKEMGKSTPTLIVAPTSLLNNWDNNDKDSPGEVQKFFEESFFRTKKIRGKLKESELNELKECDIVFTTYETLRMNNVLLGKIHWKVMICDEAQKIKNPMTLVTIAAKAQNADFKIICSATPIENSLEDLWSLTDYSKPGLLGSLKDFRQEYINTQSNEYDDLKILNDKLYSNIQDFYIRREKSILPKELPRKIIKIYKCKANEKEVEYLNRIKNTESVPLVAIQKMLAVCNHIELLNPNYNISEIQDEIDKSSKLKITKQILDDIKIKDEKVIIFTRMKKIQMILSKCIKYWYGFEPIIVNGTITDLDRRTKLINKFRNSKGFSIIILSPEVAGFGITLTEANHVIHYSRLWNPAKEDQSTDRVYRIGQDKDVIVYYPIVTFNHDEIIEYLDVEEYVEENIIRHNEELLSPEEKLNILLARKKNMLLNFFLAAASDEIKVDDFFKFDNEYEEKIPISIDDIQLNIIKESEFEALIAVLYEKMGYKSFLTTLSNSGDANIIAINNDEIIFIKAEKSKDIVDDNDVQGLEYSNKIYKECINDLFIKNIIVTDSNFLESIRSGVEVLYGDELANLISHYKILKLEIDSKNKKRMSYEDIIQRIKNQ